MRYKLMMCGFSAVCEDMQEVQERLRVIPVERAELESSLCYVFDMHTAEQYNILPTPKGWVIEGYNPTQNNNS
ncbi:hypothetical protein LS71_008760 [Helicobacter jaachi]|uniref:Uncharacterized protein n=1 Tax=Helicobacter jaachi TaxID=1677920 RepID=A0A4U8T6G3_9HELI|nr:hypothetical protein [Helicobacter jaachi]TLD95113.1 hypothetical protein LS71_008760 [Helicobacter jaachi]